MDPLASSDDVERHLGRSLTAAEEDRVDGILAKANGLFRRESRQYFTPGTITTRLKVNGGSVRLEQTPANTVSAVVDDKGRTVDHALSGQWLQVSRDGCPLGSDEFVSVTYTYGGTVPDLVRETVAEIAAKVLRVDPQAAAGVTTGTMSAGPYSHTSTYAGWAIGGATMLSPEDKELARSYRYKGTQVIVCQP